MAEAESNVFEGESNAGKPRFDKTAYQREYMAARRKLLRETTWDKERYPNRRAWEVALLRCEAARRYAIKFPDRVAEKDLKFWDFDWQYENEGLKMAQPKETRVERQP